MTPLPEPRELIRDGEELDAPTVTAENPAERGWYPRDRGPHRRDA